MFILYKLLLRIDLPMFFNIPLYIQLGHPISCHHLRVRVIPKLQCICGDKIYVLVTLKNIIASNVKTKIRHFSVMINSFLSMCMVMFISVSFLGKSFFGMTCLQYAYAHVHVPLQKIFSHKIYIGISSLQYVYAHVQLSFL